MHSPLKILVTGGDGLLAHALGRIPHQNVELSFISRGDFDLTQPEQLERQLDHFSPRVVINTAAYNQVDRCEVERDLSWAVNATGPEALAGLCARRGICLVHYGTDYVFNGAKKVPYVESDAADPVNHYAAGKLAGEAAVLRASPANLVLRTSWVFDWHPTQTKSFVHTICKAAQEGRALKSTTDQVSVPTFASDLAGWTLELLQRGTTGLFHAVNDEGVSRYDWTISILEEAASRQLISSVPPVEPVLSSFFSATMRRPDYTVLSNRKLSGELGRPLGSWRAGLRKMLAQMK
ncbi:MAG TPA: dTDP-4-dehydrorhamnose reductase [Candidatus Acidoferrum sp.]|nr:dTDP-4-dehydrorhamnose reductase [Candidatus Acidoferrum sp.]